MASAGEFILPLFINDIRSTSSTHEYGVDVIVPGEDGGDDDLLCEGSG